MRKKKIQIDQSIKQKMSDVFNNSSLANHYYLTKVINMKQRELEQQKLIELEFPENAQEVLKSNDMTLNLQSYTCPQARTNLSTGLKLQTRSTQTKGFANVF